MQQNESSTLNTFTTAISASSVPKGRGFLYHWALDFHVYTFATFFGIFALSRFVTIVRQHKHPTNGRNVHGRFTTVQLFVAASLKVVALLWSFMQQIESSTL